MYLPTITIGGAAGFHWLLRLARSCSAFRREYQTTRMIKRREPITPREMPTFFPTLDLPEDDGSLPGIVGGESGA